VGGRRTRRSCDKACALNLPASPRITTEKSYDGVVDRHSELTDLNLDRRTALKAAGAGAAGIAVMGLPGSAHAASGDFIASSSSYAAGSVATIQYVFDIQGADNAARTVWLDFHRTSYIPSGTAMSVTVDWGDGTSPVTVNSSTSAVNFKATKSYTSNGTRTVTVSNATPGIGIGYGDSNSYNSEGWHMMTEVRSWSNIGSLAGAFWNATNLVSVPNYLPTGVTNLEACFANCSNLNTPLNNWNTSYVTNMTKCFNNATVFNQNIGTWNTANVTSMWALFQGATAFNNGGSDTINNWNTAKVTNMWQTFYAARAFNQNIGSWNTGAVTTMLNMFGQTNAFNNGGLDTIKNWNTSLVTNMSGMFSSATSFNQPIGSWNTGSVTTMTQMFYHSSASPPMAFDQDISGWDVDQVSSKSSFVNTFNATTYYQSTWTAAERPSGFPTFN
jgi:surface protein